MAEHVLPKHRARVRFSHSAPCDILIFMDKQVTIYSTPTCHFCQMAKEFFTEKGVQFTNYDVSQDAAKREEMIKMTGQLGVPVIVIGGDVMVGFDRNRLADKLGIAA